MAPDAAETRAGAQTLPPRCEPPDPRPQTRPGRGPEGLPRGARGGTQISLCQCGYPGRRRARVRATSSGLKPNGPGRAL